MKKTTDTIRHRALLGIAVVGSSKPSYFEEKCHFHSPRTASNMHLVFFSIPELESRASHMLGKGSTVSMTQACAFVDLSTSTLYWEIVFFFKEIPKHLVLVPVTIPLMGILPMLRRDRKFLIYLLLWMINTLYLGSSPTCPENIHKFLCEHSVFSETVFKKHLWIPYLKNNAPQIRIQYYYIFNMERAFAMTFADQELVCVIA